MDEENAVLRLVNIYFHKKNTTNLDFYLKNHKFGVNFVTDCI
jgi:hypothetical protein